MRKFLIVAALILGAAALGLAVYFGYVYFFGGPRQPSPVGGPGGTIQVAPELKVVSEQPVFDYWLNKIDSAIYYADPGGEIYKIDPDSGENQSAGSRAVNILSAIKPSPDGSLILVEFGYPQNPTFAIHNLSTKSWQALPAGTTAAAWDPRSNNRLAYLRDNGAASRLNFLTLSDQKSREVLRLSQKDLELDWILPDVIYFKERPTNQYAGSLWAYDLNARTFRTIIREEPGLDVKWAPSGSFGIKHSGNILSKIDANNRALADFDVLTLASKCAIFENDIYCAAPSDQTGITRNFADDYLKKTVKSSENIYYVSAAGTAGLPRLISVGLLNPLIQPGLIEADHLEIQGGRRLLFINRYDSRLYSLDL